MLTELRRAIIEARLKPGQRIVQEVLADELGVSRVPLREALQVLQSEGLVEYAAHKGYTVGGLELDDVIEVYRLRALLEQEAIRSAIPRLDEATLAAMRQLNTRVDAAAEAGDVMEFLEANHEMHFLLFTASGRPRLVRLIQQLWDAADRSRFVHLTETPGMQVIRGEHADIFTALEARDVEAAVKAHAVHRENAIARLREVMSRS